MTIHVVYIIDTGVMMCKRDNALISQPMDPPSHFSPLCTYSLVNQMKLGTIFLFHLIAYIQLIYEQISIKSLPVAPVSIRFQLNYAILRSFWAVVICWQLKSHRLQCWSTEKCQFFGEHHLPTSNVLKEAQKIYHAKTKILLISCHPVLEYNVVILPLISCRQAFVLNFRFFNAILVFAIVAVLLAPFVYPRVKSCF